MPQCIQSMFTRNKYRGITFWYYLAGVAATLALAPSLLLAQEPRVVDLVANDIVMSISNLKESDLQTVTNALLNALNYQNQIDKYSELMFVRLQDEQQRVQNIALNTVRIEAAATRVDKQIGGDGSGAGSTALVAKGSVPAILGLAVEHSGIARKRSGSTVTFRGRPVGLIQALQSAGHVSSYNAITSNASLRFLNKFSFSVSFDTTRGPEANTFTDSSNQLSSYSVRYEIWNQRDARHPRYQPQWNELRNSVGHEFSQALAAVFDDFFDRDGVRGPFDNWMEAAASIIAAALTNEIEEGLALTDEKQPWRQRDASWRQVLADQIDESPLASLAIAAGAEARAAITEFAATSERLSQARDRILDYAGKGPAITLEHGQRPAEN